MAKPTYSEIKARLSAHINFDENFDRLTSSQVDMLIDAAKVVGYSTNGLVHGEINNTRCFFYRLARQD